jgi:2-C-methyl-D-erythritol 4-phosphate cytidylyltransferase
VARVWSIVVAAGSGRRFGERKQFSSLGGRPVLAWAVDACRGVSDGVVLVVPAEADADDRAQAGADAGADAVVTGGATRADSVRRGLDAVPAEADIVVVHDAARPLAPSELFAAVLAAVGEDGVDGAIPGLAPSDTIKVVDEAMIVTSTLDRTALVAVQTPQAFRAAALRAAHARAGTANGGAATDDAMLVEASGGRVRVVPGHAGNLKITTPDDLATAERLLAGRRT